MVNKNKKATKVKKPLPSPITITTYDRDDLEFMLNNPHECTACGRRYDKTGRDIIHRIPFLPVK